MPEEVKYQYIDKRRGGEHGETVDPFASGGLNGRPTEKSKLKKKKRRRRRRKKKMSKEKPDTREQTEYEKSLQGLYEKAIYADSGAALPDVSNPDVISSGRTPRDYNNRASVARGSPILGWNKGELDAGQQKLLEQITNQRKNTVDARRERERKMKELYLGPHQPGDPEYDKKMKEYQRSQMVDNTGGKKGVINFAPMEIKAEG